MENENKNFKGSLFNMSNLKEDYLISAIIPTYNGGEKLKIPIESIINQSIGFENVELIIVDDASNDKITKEIMLEYQSKYPYNIKCVFLRENSGYPGKPRNVGIDYANSDYIIFSDHDDEYLKSGFETLYYSITKYNSDMVCANAYFIINDKILKGKKRQKEENIININPLANQKNFNKLTYHNGGAPWAKIYKKKFLINNNIKYKEKIILEDLEFHLNILKHSPNITILPNDVVYNYILYNDSTCHNHTKKLLNDYINGIKSISKLLKDINLDKEYILSHAISQILLVFIDLNKQNKKESIKKIYKLEKHLMRENNINIIKPERKEVEILNKAIMQKKLKKTLFISTIYKKLYNNSFIQKIYKKFR